MIKKIFITICWLLLMIFWGIGRVYAACTEGVIRCDGNSDLERCDGVQYVFYFDCPGGCSNGVCIDQTPCGDCTTGYWSCSGSAQYYCNNTCWEWAGNCSCGCNGNKCKTPCSTSTPTPPPCDNDGNDICNTVDPICTYDCEDSCAAGQTYYEKSVYCYTRLGCLVCHDEFDIPAPLQCGTCGSAPLPTGCQPYACYNMGDIHCQVSFPGCPEGVGKCDNCSGTDCGWCGGVAPPPGPTPTRLIPQFF